MSSRPVHYVTAHGALHAFPDVTDHLDTVDWAEVTCPICLRLGSEPVAPDVEPAPAEPEPDFSDAERLGLAVVATLTEAQREAEQARAIAVRLEQELAEAVAICRDALGAWPETTWAADSMRKATLEDRLAKLTDPDGDA